MLCQPDKFKSCAACCGIYNWTDHTRQKVEEILTLQTEEFLKLRDYSKLDSYSERISPLIRNSKLFETIYNCPFAGFVDSERKRVGCMLHPEVTNNPNLRNSCFYGTKVCSEHFCPSFSCLTTTQQQLVIEAIEDWYLYGLVITDIDLVREFFRLCEDTMGDSIKRRKINKSAIEVLKEFFSLKQSWKFKATENRLGKYYFSESEYNIARIEYGEKWGIIPSRFDKIFLSLESDFKTKRCLDEAEILIEALVKRFISACEQKNR